MKAHSSVEIRLGYGSTRLEGFDHLPTLSKLDRRGYRIRRKLGWVVPTCHARHGSARMAWFNPKWSARSTGSG